MPITMTTNIITMKTHIMIATMISSTPSFFFALSAMFFLTILIQFIAELILILPFCPAFVPY
jgi:hypothetical protein